VLEGILYMSLCEQQEEFDLPVDFEGRYGPLRDALSELESGDPDDTWRSPWAEDPTLPPALRTHLTRGHAMTGLARRLERIGQEQARLVGASGGAEAWARLRREAARERQHLADLLEQSEIIRLERVEPARTTCCWGDCPSAPPQRPTVLRSDDGRGSLWVKR
jgi:hypothetical protein